MIKSDRWIARMALDKGVIEPFEARQVRQGAISFGLSSRGYDIRIADSFERGLRYVPDLAHDAATGQDLRERGDRPGPLLRVRRDLRRLVRRPAGHVSGAAGNGTSQHVARAAPAGWRVG